MADLEALVVAAYVFADEYRVAARGGRRPLVSDAELVALAVAQVAIGISSDRQFLGLIGRVLPGWFPHLPDQSQYNRRLRALVELISIVQQGLARWLDTGDARLSDGTLIGVRDRRQKLLGPRLRPPARRNRHPAAHPRQDTYRRQRAARASARLHQTRDRKRLLQPQRADAARTPPRPHTSRPRRPNRPAHPRPHHRHAAQHTQRPPSTSSRRLPRPLNHIKPLAEPRRFPSQVLRMNGRGH